MGQRVHVVPVNDTFKHDSSGSPCWCGPREEAVTNDGTGVVITHNSFDGRELWEEASVV